VDEAAVIATQALAVAEHLRSGRAVDRIRQVADRLAGYFRHPGWTTSSSMNRHCHRLE
jgi:hypothetical protein